MGGVGEDGVLSAGAAKKSTSETHPVPLPTPPLQHQLL